MSLGFNLWPYNAFTFLPRCVTSLKSWPRTSSSSSSLCTVESKSMSRILKYLIKYNEKCLGKLGTQRRRWCDAENKHAQHLNKNRFSRNVSGTKNMATTFERQLRVAQEHTEQTSWLISWHLASVSSGWNPDDNLDGRYTQLAGEMTLFEECVRVVGKTNSRLDGSGKPPGCIACVCVF